MELKYKEFENEHSNVRMHGHDMTSSFNKNQSKEHPGVKNANDTWHATKGITKAQTCITSGPKNNHGDTWHEELKDNAASIKTATISCHETL